MRCVVGILHIISKIVLVGVLLSLCAVALSGCKMTETQVLSFDTIARGAGSYGDPGKEYQGLKPNLVIITDAKGVANPGLNLTFRTELFTQLSALDYSQSFVVVVLEGKRDINSGDMVTVTQVEQQDSRVIIHARFPSNPPYGGAMEGPSSPLHIISVKKDSSWNKTMRFVLMNADKVVAQTRHFIP
jgi:hypothetical protein